MGERSFNTFTCQNEKQGKFRFETDECDRKMKTHMRKAKDFSLLMFSQNDSIERPLTSTQATLYRLYLLQGLALPFHIYEISFRTPPAFRHGYVFPFVLLQVCSPHVVLLCSLHCPVRGRGWGCGRPPQQQQRLS